MIFKRSTLKKLNQCKELKFVSCFRTKKLLKDTQTKFVWLSQLIVALIS